MTTRAVGTEAATTQILGTRFGILGPVEVHTAAGPVDIRGARRRSVLVRLLVSANQRVPIERLADDIWEGAPGAGASSTLASHVSLLRQLLGPERIANHLGSYSIAVEPGELDVDLFETALAEGRRAIEQGDLRQAVDRIECALGHWRGTPLADVAGAVWAQGEIIRLEELRYGAEEALLDARLALGLHQEVVAQAEAAVTALPLREERWATLMLALYRSGRQADALRAYQRLRTILGGELGLEPSAELTALEADIIHHSPDLVAPLAVPSPRGPARHGHDPGQGPAARLAGAAPSGIVTVLFTDLVGSTALWAGMSAEDSDAQRHAHFGVLRDALERHRGHEVKTLGDGLMAVFPSPSAALAAAAAMQQEVDRQNRRTRAPVGLRVGLSAGEVGLEESDYFGDAVVEASRLCALAGAGEVIVAAAVRTMAGRRNRLAFTDLGPLELRGIPDTVPALRLEWEPLFAEVTVIPLPEQLRAPQRVFVGRSAEQTQLTRLFAEAGRGERQVVLLAGEPGIGKTTLTSVVARTVEAAGGTVLYGRCLDKVSAPYQPFVETLGHYVQHAPVEQLRAHVGEFGGELARLVPNLSRRLPDLPAPSSSDPESERYLAFGAAVGLLAREADLRPVLLVLDDLHWADAATLQLLRHLAAATRGVPLMVLGTLRSTEITDDHPLSDVLASLWRESGVTRIDLGGLTAHDVLDLYAAAAGDRVQGEEAAELLSELHRDTAGNPYFVWELLRHLQESGGLVRDDAAQWSVSRDLLRSELPASLREVITQRAQRLGPSALSLLSLAAVVGVEFDLAVLLQVAGAPEDEVLDLVEAAERSALLTPNTDGTRFAFDHALIRNTLYDALPPSRRRSLHATVAAALEAATAPPPSPALLAYHFTAADDRSAALHYAELAGRGALDAMAADEAVRWFSRALELLEALQPTAAQHRTDLTTELGTAQRLAGDPAHRETLLDAARLAKASGDPSRMATAALANSRGYYSAAGRIDEERVAALEETLELLGPDEGHLRARLLATLCSELVFDHSLAGRRELAGRATAEAAALDDPATQVHVHNMVIEAIRHPSLLEERLEETGLALALAEDLGDPHAYFWAVSHRMRTVMEAGRVTEARGLSDRMQRTAEEVGHPVLRWMALYTATQWALLGSDHRAAEDLAERALAIGVETGQPDAVPYYATQITHLRWQQGRLAELVDLIETGARDNPGIPGYRGALARALCQAGREHEANLLLDKEATDGFADLPEDLLWTYGMVNYAEAAIQLGHPEAAASLHRRLAPYEEQLCFLGTTCEGPIAYYLAALAAVLGRVDDAESHLSTATALAAATGSPFFIARNAIERGRLAARRRDTATARRWLTEGRELAVRHGFADDVRRADAALGTLG